MPPDDILTLLRDNPTRIASLAADLTPAQLRAAPGPGAWSLTHILAHLRACADVWGGCITTMLAEEHPTLRWELQNYVRRQVEAGRMLEKSLRPVVWVVRKDGG